MGKIKNLSNYNLIQYLNTYNEIYDDINEQEDTFFKRSLQYYQLEIGNRIETWYKIIHKLTDSNFTNEEKKQILDDLKCFNILIIDGLYIQNKFIIGIDDYIEIYIKNYINICNNYRFKYNFYLQLFNLEIIKNNIRNKILNLIDQKNLELDFSDNNEFFKNFIGNMQHICKDKEWTKSNIKLYRYLHTC